MDHPTRTLPAGAAPPEPLKSGLRSLWPLDPAITFLNHGCFGSAPLAVLEAQTAWRRRLEARPVELLDRGREALLAPARKTVADFVGAAPGDLGFVTNATGAVNAVVRSLRLQRGDEIVTTSHAYNAVRQTLRYVERATGARVIDAPIDLPLPGPEAVLEAVAAAIGPRCRLLVVDHVTSPSALVLPVKRLVALGAEQGVDVLIDGAHAPGMLDLHVARLGAAWYAGNLHKWVCAPKGAAFLWARPDRQEGVHPTTISHFLDEGFAQEFSWQGTRDVTPWLCAADAIAFMGRFGWDRVRRHNHELAVWAGRLLARRWGVVPAAPADGSMTGSMATVPLPDALQTGGTNEAIAATLYDRYQIEVPLIDLNGRRWLRVSCQVYNRPAEYERLAEAVLGLAGGRPGG